MRLRSSSLISRFLLVGAAAAGMAAGWSLGYFAVREWLGQASLRVEATPAGAAVFVDGAYRGLAPLVLRLPRGEHSLTLAADGHQTLRQTVNLTGRQDLALALAPLPSGALALATTPSGAAVFIDGKLRGRTPLNISLPVGRHMLEIAAPNYLTEVQEIEISSAQEARIEVEMRHRQVAFYLQRLQQDPGDISAYNDLGELYFVLGRYEDAARIFADGLLAAGQYANRSEANRKNAEKMRNEARNKHRDAGGRFLAAFDRAVLDLVKSGKISPFLFAEFQRISYQRYQEEYMAAYRGLVQANPQNAEFLLAWLMFVSSRGLHDELFASVEGFIATPPTKDFGVHLQVIRLLRSGAEASLQPERRSRYLEFMARAVAAAKNLQRPPSLNADFHYEESCLARLQGNSAAEREALAKAVAAQVNPAIANAWRLQLAGLWRKAGDNSKARALCEEILKAKNDPAAARAKAMLEEIAKEEAKPSAASTSRS